MAKHVWPLPGKRAGPCHDLNQVGGFRPKNKDEKFKNLYYVGASTTPGTGLPMVVISSRLVTERIFKDNGTLSKNNLDCSRITTQNYSTTFSLGLRVMNRKYSDGIYCLYGFLRYADEIVDTFFDQDQPTIFEEFRQETFKAIDRHFSINPIIHSFQSAVHKYGIERELVEAFLLSMEMDLTNEVYSPELLQKYIYGSAEVWD